jgi:heptosyltransferase-2
VKKLLIIKHGASGDVLRTTTLLHLFKDWDIDWFVAKRNKELLSNDYIDNAFDESNGTDMSKVYDLVINLEDDEEICRKIMSRIRFVKVFGAYLDDAGKIRYTVDSAEWFDLGLISKYGIKKANELKLRNRGSYQEIIYRCLGYEFEGQGYMMPKNIPNSDLKGDVAIAAVAGKKWPMKTWCYFEDLVSDLSRNYRVNVLPTRQTILEHIADIKRHKLVISPDSLPMHVALGLGIPCIALFTCTSPWEIYDYGLLTKVVSPKLEQYFYARGFNENGIKCIPYEEVRRLVLERLQYYSI